MRPSTIALAAALLSTAARAQDTMPVATVAAIKEATAYIRTDIDSAGEGPAMSGSGFLIRSEGTTGYVVTNAHVILPPRGRDMFSTRPTTKVIFRSGTKAETRAVAEVVALAPERDLAVLRVAGVEGLPKPVELTADLVPFETMTVYTFGFPFGKLLARGKGNPPVNVGRGQVSSLRRADDDRIRAVILDGALNPGNSGGPVVDAKGRLVGVATATIRGANIGFATAAHQLLDMLRGEPERPRLAVKSVFKGRVELTVDVALVDPLDKVRSARLLYTTGDAHFSHSKAVRADDDDESGDDEGDEDKEPLARARRRREPEAIYGAIEGAESIALDVAQHRARCMISLPRPGGDLTVWCQVAYVDGSGRTVHARPGRYLVGAPKEGGLTVWGEVIDPDGDCRLKLDGGELAGQVPGTLHDLNVDIDKENAPRVMQEVEGDFVAEVKVGGSFRPGPVRTGPKSVPYNGGGIVVWLDGDHYLRFERASMYRNNRVIGFLAFESREMGTRAEVHNKGGLDPSRDLWLKLARRGGTFSASFRFDGQDWEDLRPMEVEWPSRLKVGVDLVNSCGDPMTVRFSDYSLARSNPQADRR